MFLLFLLNAIAMKTKFFLFSAACIFISSAQATTYYVSNSGNNNNTGLAQNLVFATLQYAADKTKPGDSVIVISGNYVGFVMGWNGYQSGTPSKRITFKAQPGATITSKNGSTADGINLEGASYITLDGFTVTNAGASITRAGIRCVVDTGVIVSNNVIDGMGTWGILTGFSESIIIEKNKCSHSGSQHGIYFGNSADNAIIRYNTCFSNAGCGIHMNSDASQGGDGIIKNALVEGNILYDNGSPGGGAAINMDGIQNSKVINNLLYNNHASGITAFQTDGLEASKNNLFYNNTVVMPSDGRWAIQITDGSTGNSVYNNVVLSYHSFRGGISIDNASLTGFKSDYNAVINRFSADGQNTTITLANWQSQTGQDQHSFVVTNTELFVNGAGNDYHLALGCKAIDAGTALVSSVVTNDLDGNSRPQGSGFDIGAYEYMAATGLEETIFPSSNLILCYPNPFTENTTVDFLNMKKSAQDKLDFHLFDLSGKEILVTNHILGDKLKLERKTLTEGTYFYTVILNEEFIGSGKLIIQ
ncbi:MAG: right-handed parallel beta-helix repeat-containing protein [Bacteroidia bacterium]